MSGIIDTVASVDQSALIRHALNEIYTSDGVEVSVENKSKSLLKFGSRTTVGTGWETMMTALGSEVQETLLSTNGITTIVSDNAADVGDIDIEYHTIDSGDFTFGVQTVTLTGTTPALITVPSARTSRLRNADASALLGNVYAYEGGTRTDANTHISIPAGDNQTQKTATTVSASDYLLIENVTINCLSKVTKFMEARLEIRKNGDDYWLPLTDTFTATNETGAISKRFAPYKIVPANHDVRLAVRTNTSAVEVSGGFGGFLAN